MVLIDKDQICAEIKAQKNDAEGSYVPGDDNNYWYGKVVLCDELLAFIDSLLEQPVAGLEEAPKEIYILQSKLAPNSLGVCWHNHALPSNTCNNIKYIRADLDKQPVDGLEEELKRYLNSDEYINTPENGTLLIARHFAEWQKVQDQKTIELAEDHAMLAGMNKMEQQMMEEAVECMVMDFSSNLPRPQVDIRLDPGKYHTGDKVKVIVIKEE